MNIKREGQFKDSNNFQITDIYLILLKYTDIYRVKFE